jgi:hypothetical protein
MAKNTASCLKRDGLAPQLCLLLWSGGTPVLLVYRGIYTNNYELCFVDPS